jgi:flagellar motor switch protein FliN/FliY
VSDIKEPRASQIEKVMVEISVLVGRSSLPMHQLLRMGRGAVIPLTATASDEVWVLVNNHPVARGDIILDDEKISVQITNEADVYDYLAGP